MDKRSRINKTLFSLIVLIAISGISFGQNKDVKLKNHIDSFSYALGMDFGANYFLAQGIEINPDVFIKAIMTTIDGKETQMTEALKQQILLAYSQEVKKKRQEEKSAKVAQEKAIAQKFLDENKTKEGVKVTASGLQYKVVEEGTGATPTATDQVKVHYKGMLIDGTVFDSSYDRGEPITFGLNRVIKGWTEGLQLMKEGAKYILYIPSDLAYGDNGAGGQIPGGAALIFEVELLQVIKQ